MSILNYKHLLFFSLHFCYNSLGGDNMTIGEKIKSARVSKGLSQKSLGNLLHVSQAMIAQYENGNRIPKIGTLTKIADALDMDISCFIEDFSLFKENTIKNNYVLSTAKRTGDLDNDLWRSYLQHTMIDKLDIDEDKQSLIFDYNKLNSIGKTEARKRVSELTKIPEYTKGDVSSTK